MKYYYLRNHNVVNHTSSTDYIAHIKNNNRIITNICVQYYYTYSYNLSIDEHTPRIFQKIILYTKQLVLVVSKHIKLQIIAYIVNK